MQSADWPNMPPTQTNDNTRRPMAHNSSRLAEAGSKESPSVTGFAVVAHALANAGVKNIYGVVGIPVTELASAAQVAYVSLTRILPPVPRRRVLGSRNCHLYKLSRTEPEGERIFGCRRWAYGTSDSATSRRPAMQLRPRAFLRAFPLCC